MQRLSLVNTALALALASAACGPSINAAAKSDIDRRVSALQPSSMRYDPPTGFEPKPLAVGQWVEWKNVDDEGRPSFMTQKIVGQQGNAWWFETETQNYYGKTASAILVDVGDRRNPDTMVVSAMYQMDNEGRINEMPPEIIGMMKSLYKSAVSTLSISWQGLPQENAAVPAGTFASCYKLRTDVEWGGWKSASMSWAHSAVPISGTVKVTGIDKPHSMELAGFGDHGAKSLFPKLH